MVPTGSLSRLFLMMLVTPLCWGFTGCTPLAGGGVKPLTIDVRSCGATGDGRTIDTTALQAAIDRVANSGGGIVSVPPGRYVCGTLILRSRVTLQIAVDAVLVGSTNIADYRDPSTLGLPMPASHYPQDESRFRGLLIALDADDIAVTGGGTIDGRGATVAANIHQMQVDHKLAGNPRYRPDESLRPCLINFVACHHVRVAGVTLKDAACWVENYSACDGLTIDRVTVRSQAFWNNDGIDISGCQHVAVSGCDIDSADDGICLKSNATACQDVTIRDCRVRSWANAIKFGTVSYVGFRHISISHCQVWGCGHAGLSIESVDGGVVDDVTVSDLQMTNLRQAILVKLGSRHSPGGNVGAIRNLTLSDITAELFDGDPDAGQPFRAPVPSYKHNRFPCIVSGLPGHPVEHLTLRRIIYKTTGGGSPTIADVPLDKLDSIPEHPAYYPEYSMHGELPAFGWFIRHASGLTLTDVEIDCRHRDSRSAIVCDDVADLDIAGLAVTNVAGATGGGGAPVVALRNVRTAAIHDATAATSTDSFLKILDSCSGISEAHNTLLP